MASIELKYVVSEFSQNEDDFEQILAAIGAYEINTELRYPSTKQEAELEHDNESDSVSLKLARTGLRAMTIREMQHVAREMRDGVEVNFPDGRRNDLQKRFAGIVFRADDRS